MKNLTGQFLNPDGTPVANGVLTLTLSQDAVSSTGQVSPTPLTFTLDANGNLTASVLGNDELTPTGTYYTAALDLPGGAKVYGPESWVIIGTSPINVQTLTPTTTGMSYPTPIISSPTGSQTVTQPASTSFTVVGPVNAKSLNQIRFADQYAGADWTLKLLAAIADLPSSGGFVYLTGLQGAQAQTTPADVLISQSNVTIVFGSGTYTVSGNFHVTGSNVALVGSGKAASTLQMVDDGSAASKTLWIDSCSHVDTSDLTVTQSNITGRTGVYGTFRLSGATDVQIRNVNIPAGSSVGIYGQQVNGLRISGLTISGTKADGIHLSRNCTNADISNFDIQTTGDDGLAIISVHDDGGAAYGPCSNIAVSNGTVKASGTGVSGRGVSVYGGHDITISNVVVDSPINSGIIVSAIQGAVSGSSTYYPYHIAISNCTVYNSGSGASATEGSGIFLSFCRDVALNGVSVLKTGVAGNGISVSNAAQDVKIVGANISNVTGYGISLSQGTTNEVRILSELWTSLGFTAPAAMGINDVSITSPTIDTSTLSGISVLGQSTQHTTHVHVLGADISGIPTGSSNRGVIFQYTDSSSIVGGSIVVSAGPAPCVLLTTCSYDLVSGVTMFTTGDGVDLLTATSCLVVGCAFRGPGVIGVFADPNGASNYIASNDFISTWSSGATFVQDATTQRGLNLGDLSAISLPIATKYNGLATVANGVPSEYAAVDLTAQVAAIATATLYAVPSIAGQYRVNWNAKVTTAATTSSTLGALTITYTDPDGVVQVITAGGLTSAGALATTNAGNTTASALLGLPLILNCKASTNIQYAFAYVSSGATAMQYNLHVRLEAI